MRSEANKYLRDKVSISNLTKRYTGPYIFVVCIIISFGWVFDRPFLKSFGNPQHFVTMKPMTLYCFYLIGIAIMFNELKYDRIKSFSLMLVGIIILNAYIYFFFDFSLLPVIDNDSAVLSVKKNMPSVMTTIAFALSSIGLCFKRFTTTCYKTMGAICAPNLIGHIFSIPTLQYYWPDISTAMAISTCILFVHITMYLQVKHENP